MWFLISLRSFLNLTNSRKMTGAMVSLNLCLGSMLCTKANGDAINVMPIAAVLLAILDGLLCELIFLCHSKTLLKV